MKILFKSPANWFACRSARAKQINRISIPLLGVSNHQIPAYKILHTIYSFLDSFYKCQNPIYHRLFPIEKGLNTTYPRLNATCGALYATYMHLITAYRALDTTCYHQNITYHRLYPCYMQLNRIYRPLMAMRRFIDPAAKRHGSRQTMRYQDHFCLNINPTYACAISTAHMDPGKSRDLFLQPNLFFYE